MERIKLLYFTKNNLNYLHEYSEYFKNVLLKQPNVDIRFWTKDGHIKDIISELDFEPDFLYFDDIIYNKNITGLQDYNVPVGLLYHDLHSDKKKFKDKMNEYKPKIVFVHYRDFFIRNFPEYKHLCAWLPHFIHTPVFKDYQLNKDIDYLLLGKITEKHYPLRPKIVKQMRNKKGFVYHEHPGYRYFSTEERTRLLVGENYAKEINRAKIFFTDDLVYKYPIKKYFEVPACNTLLLAPGSNELKDLGFKDGETFVEINESNFYERAVYYLNNKEERIAISKRGYELVNSHHTTEIRVGQFVEYINKFLHE